MRPCDNAVLDGTEPPTERDCEQSALLNFITGYTQNYIVIFNPKN